jgi:hypothetical protein
MCELCSNHDANHRRAEFKRLQIFHPSQMCVRYFHCSDLGLRNQTRKKTATRSVSDVLTAAVCPNW